ncbi:MAG: DUF3413 domain-containing protein [Succinivibrio sp.]|nr:DUF3413 domain-containing protein [Succinivibrio sp.]
MFKKFNPLLKEQVLRSSTWGHHFIFLNGLLAIFIGLVYLYGAPKTDGFVPFIYLVVTWLGQLSFLAFLSFLIIFFPLTFIGSFKWYRIISIALALIMHMLLLVDAKLFISIKAHLSWTVCSLMLRDLDFNTGLNFNFMYIAIFVLIGLEYLFVKLSNRELYKSESRNNHFPAIVMLIVSVCFIASHGIFIWADANNYEKVTNMRSLFPAHYPMTAKSFLSNHGWIDENDKKTVLSNSSFKYPLDTIVQTDPIKKNNTIMIFINGLSYSDLSQDITPNLMESKRQYTSFENHFLPYENLEDNVFAASFGLPIQYKTRFTTHDVEPVTVDYMQKLDYIIRIFSTNPSSNTQMNIAKALGINKNRFTFKNSDSEIFESAKLFIENLKPEQSYVVNINSDTLTQMSLNSKQRQEKLRAIDKAFGEFILALNDKNLLNDVMVVITSSKANPSSVNISATYSMSAQHVPMILKLPDNGLRGVSFFNISSHFDLVPTFAIEILGIQTPCSNYAVGNSLLKLPQRDFIISSKGESLLLISKNNVVVYRKNGKAYIDNNGQRQDTRPNLETLIRAMREINRFNG